MFILTIVSSSILCLSAIGLFLSLACFLGHASYLYGFEHSRETTAVIVTFHYDPEFGYRASGSPIIKYYNEFTGKQVQKELINTSVSSANASIGDMVRIQYTPKKERIWDKKYITEQTYNSQKYIKPMQICILTGLFGFAALIFSILM